jgi:hypothetical protein
VILKKIQYNQLSWSSKASQTVLKSEEIFVPSLPSNLHLIPCLIAWQQSHTGLSLWETTDRSTGCPKKSPAIEIALLLGI